MVLKLSAKIDPFNIHVYLLRKFVLLKMSNIYIFVYILFTIVCRIHSSSAVRHTHTVQSTSFLIHFYSCRTD